MQDDTGIALCQDLRGAPVTKRVQGRDDMVARPSPAASTRRPENRRDDRASAYLAFSSITQGRPLPPEGDSATLASSTAPIASTNT